MPPDPNDEPTWTFARGADRIVLRCPTRTQIVISGTASPVRRIDFSEASDRVAYQSGFESHLIDSGWSLVDFSSPRGTGAESKTMRLLSRIPFARRLLSSINHRRS
jgi:hypothetical protein